MHIMDPGVMRRIWLIWILSSRRGNIRNETSNRALVRTMDTSFLTWAIHLSINLHIHLSNKFRLPTLRKQKVSQMKPFGDSSFQKFSILRLHWTLHTLHVGIKLLFCAPWCVDDHVYTNELLVIFVSRSDELYSEYFMPYKAPWAPSGFMFTLQK